MPLATCTETVDRTCAAVLDLLLAHRRATDPQAPAPACAFPVQLTRLAGFVAAGEPITFTLPGFPCKSPSPAKVLGHLPDEGERRSLAFLDRLCAAVGEVHQPGARMVICSDGHVFGDLIGVPDHHIDAYADELAALIRRERLRHLSVFDLRAVLGELPHEEKRAHVHARYAPTVEALRAELRADPATLALYRGITRFLAEDSTGFEGTRSALQRDCRQRAYGVIQRSRAWGALIAEQYPRAVRLSIHPQPVGAGKLGIRLLDADDAWITPWHSTVLRHPDGRTELMHRQQAERLGRLVLRDGRPSHYEAR
ncbi:L-tyrosine/L-tryptophan isonitrile synthase family protein [Kitasatospora viridis]|uniref:2-isocyano-3-(4-hydroxyphenyl)propanoate synthase n=1 Tax=Kitasatospora viridis TaxID=281105 RepID=A0A561T608_9ACTN|nr:isocyanide synthase family protein [Kitasatospora viridis]TWF82538.1 2-isocyano-3-(4-hydroxyphenyl)propanoate synthase [Kitasatospora viridis]